MAIDKLVKSQLSEVISAGLSKTVQKAAANVSDTVEKLPVPTSSQVLAYHKRVSVLPKQIIEKRKKELFRLNDLRGDDRLSGFDISCPAEIFNRIKQCLFIKCRGKNQITQEELNEIIRLSDERYKIFSQLIAVKNRDECNQFACRSILDFAKEATSEQFEKVKTMVFAKGRSADNHFTWEQITDFLQKSPEEFERIKKLIYIPNRKDSQLGYHSIMRAANKKLINNREFKNMLDLLSLNSDELGPYNIRKILSVAQGDREYKKFKELHYMKEFRQKENAIEYIDNFAYLSDFKFQVLKKLLQTKKFDNDISQLELKQIERILENSPARLKKILSYLDDKDLDISSKVFYKLAGYKNSDKIASRLKKIRSYLNGIKTDISSEILFKLSLHENSDKVLSEIKKNPKIAPEVISKLLEYSDTKYFDTVKPFILNPAKYNVSSNGSIKILNRETSSKMSIGKFLEHKEYLFEKPMPNGKKELIRIIETSQGTFIDRGIIDENCNKFALDCKYKKLHNFPENCTGEEIFKFIENGDFKTSEIIEHIGSEPGHSNFRLPQGANKYKKVNDSVISQLDTTKSKNTERITIHYPDGRVAINDWDLNLSTTLDPNGLNSGMRIRKFFGSDKIDLTSSVENDIVTITDNLTGKQFKFNISEIVDNPGTLTGNDRKHLIEEYGESIPFDQRKVAIEQLFKKLSPTTILNLIKLKKEYPNIKIPFIKNPIDSCFCKIIDSSGKGQPEYITLSKCPNTTSHEAFHGVTYITDLLSDRKLAELHTKEVKNNKGLVSIMSSYATDGDGGSLTRGLDELISIMSTMNEYGVETSKRAEAVRLAFPETTKAIEKKLMEYYKQTIDSLFK